MIEKELIERIFSCCKSINSRLSEKSRILDKNKKAIALPDGTIPAKYAKAFSELENEVDELDKKLTSTERVLMKAVQCYIKDNAMGNLYFEDRNIATKYFDDIYSDLYDKNRKDITDAIDAYDFDRMDSIVDKMRELFLNITFIKYVDYSKTLSFNSNAA